MGGADLARRAAVPFVAGEQAFDGLQLRFAEHRETGRAQNFRRQAGAGDGSAAEAAVVDAVNAAGRAALLEQRADRALAAGERQSLRGALGKGGAEVVAVFRDDARAVRRQAAFGRWARGRQAGGALRTEGEQAAFGASAFEARVGERFGLAVVAHRLPEQAGADQDALHRRAPASSTPKQMKALPETRLIQRPAPGRRSQPPA